MYNCILLLSYLSNYLFIFINRSVIMVIFKKIPKIIYHIIFLSSATHPIKSFIDIYVLDTTIL